MQDDQRRPPSYPQPWPQPPPPQQQEPWVQPTEWPTNPYGQPQWHGQGYWQPQPAWPPQQSPYVRRALDPVPVQAPPVQRLSRLAALERVRGLKLVAVGLSILSFGALGALAAAHNVGANANGNSSSSSSPDQNQGAGSSQDNGGFFNNGNNGGAGFGSGNSQQPSAGTGVS